MATYGKYDRINKIEFNFTMEKVIVYGSISLEEIEEIRFLIEKIFNGDSEIWELVANTNKQN